MESGWEYRLHICYCSGAKAQRLCKGAHHIRPPWNAAPKSFDDSKAQSEEKPFQPLGVTASEILRSLCGRKEAGAFGVYTSLHKSGGATAGLQACLHRNVHHESMILWRSCTQTKLQTLLLKHPTNTRRSSCLRAEILFVPSEVLIS